MTTASCIIEAYQ